MTDLTCNVSEKLQLWSFWFAFVQIAAIRQLHDRSLESHKNILLAFNCRVHIIVGGDEMIAY